MSLPKSFVIFVLLLIVCAANARAAGEVDPSFNGSAYAELAGQGSVYVVARQADGKILVGGQFTELQGVGASGLARLNADGTLDTTFSAPDFYSFDGNNGVITGGGIIFSIVAQADGKILVGGNIRGTNSDGKIGIRRLNADGSIDSSFVITLLTLGSIVYDIKPQADGKVLIGGIFTISGTSSKNLARINTDGTRDASFTDITSNSTIKELDIQSDGKIVAGGISAPSTPGIYRYNADGTVDPSFATTQTGNGGIEAVELQADGKIIVAGGFTVLNGSSQGAISRLNSDGTRDLTFNAGGGGGNGPIYDVVVRADAKIIIAGGFSAFNGTAMQRIGRLNADGTLDNTFINSGPISDTAVNDVLILPDNRILAGLTTSTLVDPMLRFSADGVFDASFVVKASKGGAIRRILLQPDGKVLIAGNFLYAGGAVRRSLARLNQDGTLDATFVPYFNNVSPLQTINALALQPDGKILVGATNGIVLQRLNPDGSQDTAFNPGLPSSSSVYDILVQPSGKILIAGTLTYILTRFARLNSDGSRDTTFNPAQPGGLYVRKLILQPDGKLLVGGVFTTISDIATRHSVARYNSDGVLDNGFVPPVGTISVADMALQTDGKVVIAGANGVGRLNTNGSLDSTLSQTTNAEVDAVDIQPDGKILFGGGFSIIGGIMRNGIARFKPNGTIDTSFNTFANKEVLDIQLQPDRKILIGGGFSRISGSPRTRVARLLNSSAPSASQFDYDGDGKADLSVFRPAENRWYVFRSSDFGVTQQTFAIAGDIPVPADYDGDGKTDFAIYRPSSGAWWYLSSINGAQVSTQWGGQAGDVPRPSDWDGDGKADFIYFRPTTNVWNRIGSVSGIVSNVTFGLAGDKAVTGDFDGDGRSDVAIYRPSEGNWWWSSSLDNIQRATRWGISTDIPAPADYDGDGKTDFAVYRPSTGVWYIYNSSTGSPTIGPFGLSEDKPTPADYDGDGKTDIAVFRPSTGIWYMLRSTSGFAAGQFGVWADIPTPNSFVP